MPRSVSLSDARKSFDDVASVVLAGEEVVIADGAGRPLIKMTPLQPVSSKKSPLGCLKGAIPDISDEQWDDAHRWFVRQFDSIDF